MADTTIPSAASTPSTPSSTSMILTWIDPTSIVLGAVVALGIFLLFQYQQYLQRQRKEQQRIRQLERQQQQQQQHEKLDSSDRSSKEPSNLVLNPQQLQLEHQQQWLTSIADTGITADSLMMLEQLRIDRKWIIHQCVSRIEATFEQNAMLLRYGLRITTPSSLRAAAKLHDSSDLFFSDDEDMLDHDGDDEGDFDMLDDSDSAADDDDAKERSRRSHRSSLTASLESLPPLAGGSLRQSASQWIASNELEQPLDLVVIRLLLLNYFDRLHTYRAIVGADRFQSSEYQAFRISNLVHQATEMASHEHFKALEILFHYHGETLLPYRLSILNAIPYTTPPQAFAERFLPRLSPDTQLEDDSRWPAKQWRRQLDWIEEALQQDQLLGDLRARCEKLSIPSSSASTPIQRDTILLSKLYATTSQSHGASSACNPAADLTTWESCDYPTTEAQLSAWFEQRARSIERDTGLTEHARSLIEFGVEKSLLLSLSDSLRQWQLLSVLVYQVEQDISFDALCEMEDYERLTLLLSDCTERDIVARLHQHVWPLLFQRTSVDSEQNEEQRQRFEQLLQRYLIQHAKQGQLSCAARVLQASRPIAENPIEHRIIRTETTLLETVLLCSYNCRITNSTTLACMSSMFRCLPERNSSSSTDVVYQQLHDLVDSFEIHLEACESLHRLKLSIPIATFVGISAGAAAPAEWHLDEHAMALGSNDSNDTVDSGGSDTDLVEQDHASPRARRLIVELLRQGKTAGSEFGEREWQGLVRAILSIQQLLVPEVPLEFCYRRICEALLSSSQWTLAREYLTKLAKPETADALVLKVSQEMFNSAASMDDTVLESARLCLALASKSDFACETERELHDSIHMLRSFFKISTMLPVQVRLLDKHVLLERILDRSPDACLDPEPILDLARKLGLSSSGLHQVRVSLATRATLVSHWETAVRLCHQLVLAKYANAWQLCMSLATASVESPQLTSQDREQFLAFALAHCPGENLELLLGQWKQAQLAQLQEKHHEDEEQHYWHERALLEYRPSSIDRRMFDEYSESESRFTQHARELRKGALEDSLQEHALDELLLSMGEYALAYHNDVAVSLACLSTTHPSLPASTTFFDTLPRHVMDEEQAHLLEAYYLSLRSSVSRIDRSGGIEADGSFTSSTAIESCISLKHTASPFALPPRTLVCDERKHLQQGDGPDANHSELAERVAYLFELIEKPLMVKWNGETIPRTWKSVSQATDLWLPIIEKIDNQVAIELLTDLADLIQSADETLHEVDSQGDVAPLHEVWTALSLHLLGFDRRDTEQLVRKLLVDDQHQSALHLPRLTLEEEQGVWEKLGASSAGPCLQFKLGLASRHETIRRQTIRKIRQSFQSQAATHSQQQARTTVPLCDVELVPQLLSLGLLVDCIGDESFNHALTSFLRQNTKWADGAASFTSLSIARNGQVQHSLAHIVSRLVLARRYNAAASLLMVVFRLHRGFTTRKNGLELLRTFLEAHINKWKVQQDGDADDEHHDDDDLGGDIEDDEEANKTIEVTPAQCKRACQTALHMISGML